ncbi:MAG TPA: succinate dehydrogenase, cytochrome b556 subunit [Rhizomicrobium sp.]|jgi:succinate dehydrogenase / fumarate reductase cytochrome b subunit|nr:succinate dehydrogenase, cytochrome b556 subunit [Rhizomicrobium sp.]
MAEKANTAHVAARPQSPHLQIYRWPISMATSIVHRLTGMALFAGSALLAWWLIAAASGPDAYETFARLAATPLGQIILFGFLWSLSFHLLNGIRHLFWDMGFGFKVPTANRTGILVIALSIIVAVAFYALAYSQHGGFSL